MSWVLCQNLWMHIHLMVISCNLGDDTNGEMVDEFALYGEYGAAGRGCSVQEELS